MESSKEGFYLVLYSGKLKSDNYKLEHSRNCDECNVNGLMVAFIANTSRGKVQLGQINRRSSNFSKFSIIKVLCYMVIANFKLSSWFTLNS